MAGWDAIKTTFNDDGLEDNVALLSWSLRLSRILLLGILKGLDFGGFSFLDCYAPASGLSPSSSPRWDS